MRNSFAFFFVLVIAITCIRCNRGPYYATNKTYHKKAKELSKELLRSPAGQTMSTAPEWVGTVNFNMRKPNLVIIHHTAQNSCDQTLKTFTLERTQVSAHYVVCRDGTVHHMLNDYLRAWHGGIGRWGNINDINSASIGIELDNNGFEPFPEPQVQSLTRLLDTLKRKYGIPQGNFIGHADIAPTRKNDPNVLFPWKQFSDNGFGHWWSDTTAVTVPETFSNLEALRIIGYDVRDTAAVYQAFRRKYLGLEGQKTLDEVDRKVLFSLYKKYM